MRAEKSKNTLRRPVLTALVTAVGVAGPAWGGCLEYEITAIIEWPGGPDDYINVSPLGMNDASQIVGYYSGIMGPDRPFLWDDGEFITFQLPDDYVMARMYDINNSSQIAGTIGGYNKTPRGFLYDSGQFTVMGTLPGGNYSWAESINEKGQIAGYWGDNIDADPPRQAFLWENGVMTNLGPDFPEVSSNAQDINDNSQITGTMQTVFVTKAHPFIWEAGEVTDLGHLVDDWDCFGRGINNLGHTTGHGKVEYYFFHAFFWSDGEMQDIGVLPGYEDSRANFISDTGMVLGYCEANWPLDGVAFVWDGETMHNLNDLISPNSDVRLYSAKDMNLAGQIVATGEMNALAVGVLLTPVDSRPADVNDDGVVDIDDLFEVLSGWGPCPDPPQVCPADVNCDHVVDINDIFDLLIDWG